MLSKIFKSLKKQDFDLSDFYTTDIHSHLIPDIDDGVKTLDESIEIITSMKKLGYKKLITTPHIMQHRFPNKEKNILSDLEALKEELIKRDIDIQIEAAAEYYYDEYFIEKIRKNKLLTFGNNYVLFEFSYRTKPFNLEQIVYELLEQGYKPILAHPERYSYFSSFDKYHQLKDLGLYFQLNLNSLNGFYGKKPLKAAQYLVDKSLIDFIGSDIHNKKYFDSFSKFIGSSKFEEVFEKNQIKNDFI